MNTIFLIIENAPQLILIITEHAWDGAVNISDYLENQFSKSLALDYLSSLKLAFNALAEFPDLGVHFQGNVRKLIWKKYTLIFYRYDDNYLYVLDVVDSRSSPLFNFLD